MGTCKKCGGPTKGVRKFCGECWGAPKVGACRRCGRPTIGGKVFCSPECRSSPRKCAVCGKPTGDKDKKYCSPECHPRNYNRLCRCGKPALPRRMTCSDECAQKFHGVPLGASSKTCPVCGAEHRRGSATCSPECAERQREQVRQAAAKTCPVCGKTYWSTRKTCSDDCARQRMPQFTGGHRSESVREKRRRHKRNAYKRPDKAQVIARLLLEQKGLCAVCGSNGEKLGDGNRGLVLDHDHTTGAPRALLCTRCNVALGMLKESKVITARMLSYIQHYCDAQDVG